MKTVSELSDYYYNVLHKDLEELESERKKLKKQILTKILIISVIGIALMLILDNISNHEFNGVIFIIFIIIALNTYIYKKMIKEYVLSFKLRIMAPLIKALDENLSYSPSSQISSYIFENSKLFKHKIDRYSGNDLVRGSVDGINLQFSDIHAEYESRDSKGNSRYNTIFQGLFIVAEFNKYFKSTTIVLPDSAEKTFGKIVGSWLQSNSSHLGELIKMDSVEFEKQFVVYGNDQIEARYLLTPTMMQHILDLKNRSKQNIYISFTNEQIYIAIEYNKDLFEPSIFTSLLDYKSVMEYINTLKLAVGIIQELKLNQKLWSKQ